MELHVHPVWAVLRMATEDAARILGMGDRTGRIAKGLDADVLFLRANPAEDLRTLYDPALVLANGRPFNPQAVKAELP